MQANALSRAKSRVHFTKRAIDDLPVPAVGRQYIYDVATPGLALCITASGSRTFYSYRKVNGRPERVRIGRWPQWSIENARDEAQRIAGNAVDGATPNDAKRAERVLPTLKEVFEQFIILPTRTKAKRPKSPKTVEGYRYQFDTFLADWQNRRLSKITRTEMERLHIRLGNDHGFYMANRVLALIKALFNTAIEQGHPVLNPASRLRPFEEHSRERFLQADELPRFWTALEAEPSEKIRDFVKLALFTGQRRSNVLAMRWAELNLDRGVWVIPRTKTGRHEVPLPTLAVEILKRRQQSKGDSEYVLPGLHGREHLKDPMRQWRSILKAAGIGDLRIHDLRRSLGSWQSKTGASLTVVGKTLGHSQAQTTLIYGRLDHDPVRAAMDTAATAMMAAAKPPKATRKRKTK